MSWRRTFRDIIIAILVFTLLSIWLSRHLLDEGTSVGEYTLTRVNTTETTQVTDPVSLEWPSQSEKTLLYFFAPWCSICRISMPGLNLFAEQSGEGNSDIRILAVALDYEDPEAVRVFAEETGFKGTVVLGDESMRDAFRVTGYPSYYVLDKEGKVIHSDRGLSTPPGLWLRMNI